jgi:hypothetical protein
MQIAPGVIGDGFQQWAVTVIVACVEGYEPPTIRPHKSRDRADHLVV